MRAGPLDRLRQQQGGAGLADRVAELAPQPTGLLGELARRWLVDRRLEQQALGDGRAVAMRVRQLQRRLGPAGCRRPVPAAQLHPATGQQRVRLRHGVVGFDRPLGEGSGPSGVVGREHPGRADQRRDESLQVASPLGPGDRLGVERERLRALTAEVLHVAELAGGVVDELGADPLPDVLGTPEVTAGVVETAHAQVRVAAVEVGEPAERLRADQLGGLDGVASVPRAPRDMSPPRL